ncbi:MAG: DNA alkylation repair protein [Micropruina sp.]|nr:MAG: DNA alkylation repair protein [Micropruina sp.]
MVAEQALAALRAEFTARACPTRAAAAQRYMKSALPYYGSPMPEVRTITNRIWAQHRFRTRAEWLAAVDEVWAAATHREERYAAIGLLRHRLYRQWADDQGNLPTLRRLIVSGAWWDVVDEIASHCVGAVLRGHPDEVGPVLRGWARDDDLWVRRSAILSQLTFKERTDPVLLADCIVPSIPDPDFFARKAIGWALRQYATTDPDWVRAFVVAHPGLSGLSKREALKHLNADLGPETSG